MIKFTTFSKAVNCIERGGAAYRYPNYYPLWYKGNKRFEPPFDGQPFEQYQRSANIGWSTLIQMPIQIKPYFSKEEQEAKDWVLVSKKKFEEGEKVWKKRKAEKEKEWAKQIKDYQEKQKLEANTPTVETANTMIQPIRPMNETFWDKLYWAVTSYGKHEDRFKND
jgi:hypothetical protein